MADTPDIRHMNTRAASLLLDFNQSTIRFQGSVGMLVRLSPQTPLTIKKHSSTYHSPCRPQASCYEPLEMARLRHSSHSPGLRPLPATLGFQCPRTCAAVGGVCGAGRRGQRRGWV